MARLNKLGWYLKVGFYALEFLIAIPLALPFIALGWLGIWTGRFSEVSLLVSKIPFYLGEHIRYLYYRATLRKVGKRVAFKYGSFCQYREAWIGDRVTIGYYNALGMISIGNDVQIGGFVNFTSGRHQHSFEDTTKKMNEQPGKTKIISIGSDVWIGSNSIITDDIGDRCVIGSGSVVVKPIEAHSIYAGNPARLIRKID